MSIERKRYGFIAIKQGMTQIAVDSESNVPDYVAGTLLWIQDTIVVDKKTKDRDGYESLILGVGRSKEKNWNNPQLKMFEGLDFIPKYMKEFKFENIDNFSKGQFVDVEDFLKIGSLVDIQGKTLGKGFSGGMKRHGFAGLRATHGVSKAHRSCGSTGSRKPGRVFKGKKMPGRYGNETVTCQNLEVLYISKEKLFEKFNGSLILVKGAVPGYKGSACNIYSSFDPKGGVS
ncbi:50S ribosomal protein L3 [Candidatus Nesciobacter abundans]|uniref:50S ribosomal protein L3 n=1 Tax=Candidatus Nesciobacter abundans TaxID=2601668 RepID=A0A5C0UGV6_9PROT|nr:50S ribosomal protein L3 [Candidatus Nesciobacter abundans]QEK38901.1 50S ribosomal protein L3 [Candidatus Nesciobacter abundans]